MPMGEALSSGEYCHALGLHRVLLLENELEGRPDKTMGRFIWSLFVLFGAFLRQRVIEQPSSSEWISGEFGMTSGPPSSFFLLWKVAKWGPSFVTPPSVNRQAFRRSSGRNRRNFAGEMRETASTGKADGCIMGKGRLITDF